jgi:hypothetical protein
LLDVQVTAVPLGAGIDIPTWFGIPCALGMVKLSLAVDGPVPLREFDLLVLLPERELPDAPPFILFGAEFIVRYQVRVLLEGTSPASGQLVIP